MHLLKPFDLPIVVSLLIVSCLPVFIFWHQQATQSAAQSRYATISINGKIAHKVPLSRNHKHYTFTLHPHRGQYNIIEVDGARIRDKEDNTPDQIAVHTSWISAVGQQSICLPHKLIIQIHSQHEPDTGAGLVQP